MKIEQLKLDSLIPYALNSRTHDDAQVAQIAASIREFGFTNPVLIDADGGIIAGHGRVLAARKLELADVPCIRLDYLSEMQRKAYVIADNRLALNAGWDMDMLAIEVGQLAASEFDLTLLGFTPDELSNLSGDTSGDFDDTKPAVEDESRNLLMIECDDEKQLETLFGEMQERGLKCKILS